MAEKDAEKAETFVERWLKDQQEWQKTALSYLDSMVQSDEFLVHLGNAMRGSLLAGKPYPTPVAQPDDASVPPSATDERLDQILHALHLIQGELADLRMMLGEAGRLRRAELTSGQPSPDPPGSAVREGKGRQLARKASKPRSGAGRPDAKTVTSAARAKKKRAQVRPPDASGDGESA